MRKSRKTPKQLFFKRIRLMAKLSYARREEAYTMLRDAKKKYGYLHHHEMEEIIAMARYNPMKANVSHE